VVQFLGAALFAVFFLLIKPSTREFVLASVAGGMDWMNSWAPFSFIVVAVLIAAPIVSIFLIRTWPVHVEPENPMAKYRRDPMQEPDEF
jgi:hypothetical protein